MSEKTRFGVEFHYSKNEIYLDSATVGKLPVQSLENMREFYSNIGGSNRGTHKYSIESSRVLEKSRNEIANIFGTENEELSFLPSREVALFNALLSFKGKYENRVLTTVLEDHSILGPILRTKQLLNYEIKYLNLEQEVNLVENIKDQIEDNPSFVILSALTLGLGSLRNWEEIAQICRKEESLFILDISYAIGHQNFNFSKIKPDVVVSSSSSGALGPFGASIQFIDKELISSSNPFLVGGGSIISLERDFYKLANSIGRYEPGILDIGSISGLTNSLKILNNIGFETIRKHENELHRQLHESLSKINGIKLIGLDGINQGPIMSFKSPKIDSHDIAIVLEDIAKIYVRSGALCSHLFMSEIKEDSLVQVSTHVYNTEEEIKIFTETLSSIMDEM